MKPKANEKNIVFNTKLIKDKDVLKYTENEDNDGVTIVTDKLDETMKTNWDLIWN